MKQQRIPIFFSCDDNYLPYLAVSLCSLEANASKRYQYDIYILHTNSISKDNQKRILKELNGGNFHLQFQDISIYVESTRANFHCRDYYTPSTYYRIFIASLFPQYDKVLYLDSDIIVQGDISELYNKEIKFNLLGGIVEDVMTNFDVFGTYVENALGIKRNRYINAGILLINTKLFREEKIEEKFYDLISRFTFYVTQDEDYLNVLCKGRITYINPVWNRTPIPNTELPIEKIKLIHYKMGWKPWKYDAVMYGDIFWKYAYKVSYFNDLLLARVAVDEEKALAQDRRVFDSLAERARLDSNDPNNYRHTLEARNEISNEVINEQLVNNI